MSRVAKSPIKLPSGVEFKISDSYISAKGPKGELKLNNSSLVDVKVDNGDVMFSVSNASNEANAMSGTMRSLVNNLITGVTKGFEKKLTIIGVGYRAKAQGKKLDLTLGFSHPVVFQVPEGITIETPSQTEIVVKGADKQLVGQTAAEIRDYRSPEPYKGKGIRYTDEHVVRKQAQKEIVIDIIYFDKFDGRFK